jgi:tol-pal system protein YbgF
MTAFDLGAIRACAVAAALAVTTWSASAQEAPPRPPGNLLDRIFGAPDRPQPAPPPGQERVAQLSQSDLVMRLERLESQIRQLTGLVEQLQYRNQQLEGQLRRMQEDTEYRFQQLGAKGPAPAPARQQVTPAPTRSPNFAPPTGPAPAGPPPGTRGDLFDPTLHPNAPGAPQQLGTTRPTPPPAPPGTEPPTVGAPGGRQPGAPLDLSTLASREPPPGPPAAQPPRTPGVPGPVASVPPPAGKSPKEDYDLAYGHIMRKEYPQAEAAFRAFLKNYPSDRLASDAQFWLGESLFQRQQYRDAAEIFLNVSTKYEGAVKAPDSLLRLGQSLAQLGEKEMACATLGAINNKYPKASAALRQTVEREQKRVRC